LSGLVWSGQITLFSSPYARVCVEEEKEGRGEIDRVWVGPWPGLN